MCESGGARTRLAFSLRFLLRSKPTVDFLSTGSAHAPNPSPSFARDASAQYPLLTRAL
jgi:hypothetical protein